MLGMITQTTAHYHALLDEVPMIDEALCWTVVRGVGPPITVEQVISRIGGDPTTLAERDWDAAFDHFPTPVVHLAQIGSAVTMFEVNGMQGQRPEVLRWLSDRACVHSVYWHVNGADRLMYAAYGRVITGVDVFDPTQRHGEDPAALDDDLQELVALRADNGHDYRPAAMAVLERRTGVRLPTDWFEQPRLSVIIAEPLPDDPTPPTGLASVDPDLHVLLSLAGPEVRNAALVRLVRLLAERFDLSGEPDVSQALAALASGAVASLPPRLLLELRSRLSQAFQAVRDQGPMEENPAWRRMQAVLAICAAVAPSDGYSDPLGALNHAHSALGADWPAVRNELRGLARANLGASEADPS